jgi:hypothetical protein
VFLGLGLSIYRTRSPTRIREASKLNNSHSFKMAVNLDSILFYNPPSKATSSSNHQPSRNFHIPRAYSSYRPPPKAALSPEQEINNIEDGVNQFFTTHTSGEGELLHYQDQEYSDIPAWHKGILQPPLTMAPTDYARCVTG